MIQLSPLRFGVPTNYDDKILEKIQKEEEEINFKKYKKIVPSRYWSENFSSYKAETDEKKKALETVKSFSERVKKGAFETLVLLGGVGTGKTHLACSVLRECGGLYKLSSELTEEIRGAKSYSSKTNEKGLLDYYGYVNLLVIDEIGRGLNSLEEKYMLYQIINLRYNARKPLILISNQNKKDFLNYIGVAAVDRLTESSVTVQLTWSSYRANLRPTSNSGDR